MILRRALAVKPRSEAFVKPCRKVVLSYCEKGGSSAGLRNFLASEGRFKRLAERHAEVEMVVMVRPNKHPHVTGIYANGRDKSICVRNMDANQVNSKVQLLLDSSGSKVIPIRRPKVESTTPSVRGIWSPFHEQVL